MIDANCQKVSAKARFDSDFPVRARFNRAACLVRAPNLAHDLFITVREKNPNISEISAGQCLRNK
jgi:hypothetical protein